MRDLNFKGLNVNISESSSALRNKNLTILKLAGYSISGYTSTNELTILGYFSDAGKSLVSLFSELD